MEKFSEFITEEKDEPYKIVILGHQLAGVRDTRDDPDTSDTGLLIDNPNSADRTRITMTQGSAVGDACIALNYYGLGIGWHCQSHYLYFGLHYYLYGELCYEFTRVTRKRFVPCH